MMLALKSMTYFRDTEKQIMPKLIVDVSWEEIKRIVYAEVNKQD